MTKRIITFVASSGQDDNIGDVVLRRRMLKALQEGSECHIWRGSVSDSFFEGLLVSDGHVAYRDWKKWILACTLAAFTKNIQIVHNPGQVSTHHKELYLQLLLVPASIVARARRKRVVRIGEGIQGTKGRWWPILKILPRLDSVTIWRDQLSREFFGIGKVRPDWAFDDRLPHEDSYTDLERNLLVISMRFDRPEPSEIWYSAMQSVAKTLGAKICVTAQVFRDNESGQRIADRLGASFVPWKSESHLDQEKKVRRLYRQSIVVVSDRLHALVIALTEGATPVGALNGADIKLARHFDAAGIHDISFDSRELSQELLEQHILGIVARGTEIQEQAIRASEAVRECDWELFHGSN